MKTRFQPIPDGEPPLDVKPFLHRLRHDPGFAETMQAHYENMLATPHSPDTADMHQAALAALAALRTLKHHQGAWKGTQDASTPWPTRPAPPLLDTQEPHSTVYPAWETGSDSLLHVPAPEILMPCGFPSSAV
jgi:hypothetical protein